jgi:predicted nucleic acid-binding protein
MPPSVYVETSVISYYTARPSRDVVTAARQTLTQEWWEDARERFDLYVSVLVIEEAKIGGADAAQRRLSAILRLPILQINEAAEQLAKRFLDEGAIPPSSPEDALHISLATVHGMDFLLTWNFRHINNAELKTRIRTIIEAAGYESPVICSPEELGGGEI